jgi:hypothetical protein
LKKRKRLKKKVRVILYLLTIGVIASLSLHIYNTFVQASDNARHHKTAPWIDYKQTDKRWANQSLYGDETIGQGGCYVTSEAIWAAHLGKKLIDDSVPTPGKIVTLARQQGQGQDSDYINASPVIKGGLIIGATQDIEDNQLTIITEALKQYPAVLISMNFVGTIYEDQWDGHWVLATGVKNGAIEIHDPAGINTTIGGKGSTYQISWIQGFQALGDS